MIDPSPFTRNVVSTFAVLAFVLTGFTSAGGVEPLPKEKAKTPETLQAAADAGDPEAQFLLGKAYWHGDGVGVDRKKAVEFYRKAAEKNHPNALAGLGAAYTFGSGVAKDDHLAAEYARKAAELGSAIGQLNLGGALLEGRGVEKNPEEGLRWLANAGEQGLVPAQVQLAQLYFRGESGAPRDYAQAATWARRAADLEEPTVLNLYGVMLRDGLGLEQDLPASVSCFQRAVDKNCLAAYRNLGLAYFGGRGAKRDRITGLSLFYAGELLGDPICAKLAKENGGDWITEECRTAKERGEKLVRERSPSAPGKKVEPVH